VLLDAGTGLGTFDPFPVQEPGAPPCLLLLSHYHLDHLVGLPAFGPLRAPGFRLTVAAPRCGGFPPEEPVRRLLGPPFWPDLCMARLDFRTLADAPAAILRHGPYLIRWCAVAHEGGCHAYRVDECGSGASLVFATDLEWSLADGGSQAAFLRLCTEPAPADLLLMDGTEESHGRWGHSAWQDAVQVACETGAGRLVVIHLSPQDDDRALRARETRLRARLPSACLGRQGLVLPWKKG
jgi:ribonuclease BN (tRNA processing enzyme)